MFGWLKKNPVQQLEQEYAKKLEQAMQLQRKGDIVGYAAMTAEAESILEKIQASEGQQNSTK